MKVNESPLKKPEVDLKLNLEVSLTQYPVTEKITDKTIKELEKVITKDLTKRSKKIITATQKANSDVLGIGRTIKETDPSAWQSYDWRTTYPHIEIKTAVDVKIVNTGTIK
jgi:hypothetical protein